MRVSASMESLWRYIESLSLSERNRQWLAGKLLENPDPQHTLGEPQEEYISKEEVLEMIDSGLNDIKAGRTSSAREVYIYRDSLRGGGRDKSADHLRQV